ncbi:MAG: hypothetical protein EF813_04805, partial [Methanosarcinales archaeon]
MKNMKSVGWEIRFGLSLILLSAILYLIHYAIFRDSHHIFIYMLGHIAFVPIEVLLVALILQRLLDMREKRAMLNKLNMVIGTFFSEVGDDLLAYFSEYDIKLDKIRKELVITDKWSDQEFMDLSKHLKNYDYSVNIQNMDLGHLQSSLVGHRNFLLRLLENPNLLEHESFTDLLRAVFHLTEELAKRGDLKQLP